MSNKLIANKIKENNNERILFLSEQTKNLFPKKISVNNKILLKVKLKSAIKRTAITSLKKNKTKEINTSKIRLNFSLENNKNNIGIINYKLAQPRNYLINQNRLINNILNLNDSHNDKLPNINDSKIRNNSLVNTHKKFDITLKKISLVDLSKYSDNNNFFIKDLTEINNSNMKNINDTKKVNLDTLEDNIVEKVQTEKNNKNRNAKLLQKFYKQKLMNYDRLIKEMERETELKKNVMNEYINLMKENFENSFEV